MHLHRQSLRAIEEFEQQRELIARVMAAKNLLAVLRHKLVQCFAGQWSIGDGALVGAVVDDFPTFGVVLAFTDWFAEIGSETPAAPQVFSQDWIESKRRKWVHGWGLGTRG